MKDELANLKDLMAKMTQGEWQVFPGPFPGLDVVIDDSETRAVVFYGDKEEPYEGVRTGEHDAAGIVALVNAAPALLASAARAAELEAEVARLRHTVTDMVQHVEWLTSGLPGLLDEGGLTDEEGLIGAAIDAAKSARATLGKQQ